MGGVSEGPATDTYTFTYYNKARSITQANLNAAVSGKKLYKSKLPHVTNQIRIALKRNMPNGTKTNYWTTAKNLKDITVTPSIK
jgi:hypothetical protein